MKNISVLLNSYISPFPLPQLPEMCSNSEIPTVDLTGLHLPSGDQWEAAKSAVTAALHSHGCFEAIYPSLSPELRHEMFATALPNLFSLPLDSKLRSTSSKEPYQAYIAPTPSLAYESLRIDAADSPISVQNFTNLMWPQGNSAFYNATVAFTKALRELAEMVQKMVLERLGVEEKRYDEFLRSINHGIRLSEYGVPVDQKTKIGLPSHVDPNYLSIVCQHEIGGLEVQNADGGFWIRAEPNPNSVYVMAGLAFQAWSNMSVRAPTHRVRMFGNEKRFSAIYGTRPIHNTIVKTPEELGNDPRRPLVYKPFNYTELIKFLYSEQGLGNGTENAFNSYCRLEN